MVVAAPIRLYMTPLFNMSLLEHAVFFAAVTAAGAFLLSQGCTAVAVRYEEQRAPPLLTATHHPAPSANQRNSYM